MANLAKYDSKCARCGCTIKTGSAISFEDKNIKIRHSGNGTVIDNRSKVVVMHSDISGCDDARISIGQESYSGIPDGIQDCIDTISAVDRKLSKGELWLSEMAGKMGYSAPEYKDLLLSKKLEAKKILSRYNH